MQISSAHEAQVDRNDLCRNLHVEAHARLRHEVLDAFRDLEHATTPRYSERFHGGGDGQADGLFGAFRIGNHEVFLERIPLAVNAFYAGVEALQIDAAVCSWCFVHAPSITHKRTYVLVSSRLMGASTMEEQLGELGFDYFSKALDA